MPSYNDISKPAHYVIDREYEPRKVIMDWGLNFYLGNVVKYIARAGRKDDTIKDLEKARQYLTWEIERLYSEEMEAAYEEFERSQNGNKEMRCVREEHGESYATCQGQICKCDGHERDGEDS